MHRHLNLAKTIATNSSGIGRRNSFRVGAVLYRGKYVYNARFNERKTHRILSRYSEFPFLHAESSCIIHHGLDNCHGLDLLVVRIGMRNDLRLAKPCEACLRLIKDVGIRKVFYSCDNGLIEEL